MGRTGAERIADERWRQIIDKKYSPDHDVENWDDNQLAWAADNLNRGYYLWRVNGVPIWILSEGTILSIDASINAGTAGVQHFFSQLYDGVEWEQAVTSEGLFSTYNDLFGYPFHKSFDPILPDNLVQPAMRLPFEDGQPWSFTGGPHGGAKSSAAQADPLPHPP